MGWPSLNAYDGLAPVARPVAYQRRRRRSELERSCSADWAFCEMRTDPNEERSVFPDLVDQTLSRRQIHNLWLRVN